MQLRSGVGSFLPIRSHDENSAVLGIVLYKRVALDVYEPLYLLPIYSFECRSVHSTIPVLNSPRPSERTRGLKQQVGGSSDGDMKV